MGIDEVGIDKVGIDKVGITPMYVRPRPAGSSTEHVFTYEDVDGITEIGDMHASRKCIA